MALTAISWTHRRHPLTGILHPGYTFNPWIGCTRVSRACKLCYAALEDTRKYSKTCGGTKDAPVIHWGKGAPRHHTSPETWKNPLRWNAEAEKAGIALAVFCGSLCDWADEEVSDAWRDELLELVLRCQNLEWLFLTKRPARAREYFATRPVPPNVRMGATMENQQCFDARIHDLLAIDAPLGYFASMEPLLGHVDISAGLCFPEGDIRRTTCCAAHPNRGLGWVIVGGESCADGKQHSEPMHPDDALAVATQCWAAGVPFTFKQWGDWCPAYELDSMPQAQAMCVMGKVRRHTFPTGEKGRRFSFNVGKQMAGRTFEGRIWEETPKVRVLPYVSNEPINARFFREEALGGVLAADGHVYSDADSGL